MGRCMAIQRAPSWTCMACTAGAANAGCLRLCGNARMQLFPRRYGSGVGQHAPTCAQAVVCRGVHGFVAHLDPRGTCWAMAADDWHSDHRIVTKSWGWEPADWAVSFADPVVDAVAATCRTSVASGERPSILFRWVSQRRGRCGVETGGKGRNQRLR